MKTSTIILIGAAAFLMLQQQKNINPAIATKVYVDNPITEANTETLLQRANNLKAQGVNNAQIVNQLLADYNTPIYQPDIQNASILPSIYPNEANIRFPNASRYAYDLTHNLLYSNTGEVRNLSPSQLQPFFSTSQWASALNTYYDAAVNWNPQTGAPPSFSNGNFGDFYFFHSNTTLRAEDIR